MRKLGLSLLFLFIGISVSVSPVFAYGDCYRECMEMHGCQSSMDSGYCSGTQARCSTECRNAAKEKSYGAIAYSKKNGAYGFSDGRENQKKAEQAALKYCTEHGSGCKSEVWFYNSCGAVASDGKKIVTWGQADSEQAARQQALDKCSKGLFFKRKCEVKVSHCSR